MKSLFLLFTFTIFTMGANAQNSTAKTTSGTTITVTIPTQSSEGSVMIGLYTEDIFMKAAPMMHADAPVKDGKATVTFENVPAGDYAILLYQDKNDNKQMDFEANGMPTEPYGASNNIMSFGPPLWNDTKFEVGTEPVSLEIRM